MAGNLCEDIARAYSGTLARYGFEKTSRSGYPIGMGYPTAWGESSASFREGDKTELKPGMTFHFMSGLWYGDWGIEITESILITDRQAEFLSNVPRKLLVIDTTNCEISCLVRGCVVGDSNPIHLMQAGFGGPIPALSFHSCLDNHGCFTSPPARFKSAKPARIANYCIKRKSLQEPCATPERNGAV